MYSNIFELPSQVLASLSEEDCQKWMEAYNKCNPQFKDDSKKAKKEAWRACRELPSSFSFEIVASTDTVDKAKDVIDLDTIKAHMDSFIDYGGNIQNDHHNYTVGTIWDWKPAKNEEGIEGIIAYGNLFGGDLVYDNMRKAFVNGMNSLSVAGEAAPGKYQCDERGCYTRRNVEQLLEISICQNPMNQYCTMQWYNDKASLTKSASSLHLGVKEYSIHRDMTTCPYLSLKKSLSRIGYTGLHAGEDGVYVPMDMAEFAKAFPRMVENGLCADYSFPSKSARVNRRPQYIERAFKKCYDAGAVTADGYITKEMPRQVFKALYYNNVLEDMGYGTFRFKRQ